MCTLRTFECDERALIRLDLSLLSVDIECPAILVRNRGDDRLVCSHVVYGHLYITVCHLICSDLIQVKLIELSNKCSIIKISEINIQIGQGITVRLDGNAHFIACIETAESVYLRIESITPASADFKPIVLRDGSQAATLRQIQNANERMNRIPAGPRRIFAIEEELFDRMEGRAKGLAKNERMQEAMMALTALGYSQSEAERAVSKVAAEGMSVEEILRQSLKQLY